MPFCPLCYESEAILSKTFRPGNRDGVFIWKNFQPSCRDVGWKKPRSRQASHPTLSYVHSEIFTKDLVMYRDLGNRASPVNRDHMKKPLGQLVINLDKLQNMHAF